MYSKSVNSPGFRNLDGVSCKVNDLCNLEFIYTMSIS
jgi:hypothetical protein